MRSSRSRVIIKKIAETEGLSIKQVEEIVYSFFRFTSKQMKEGDKYTRSYKPIRLFKFGIFKVKQGRINQLRRRDEKLNHNRQRVDDNQSGSDDNQGVQKDLEQGSLEQEG